MKTDGQFAGSGILELCKWRILFFEFLWLHQAPFSSLSFQLILSSLEFSIATDA